MRKSILPLLMITLAAGGCAGGYGQDPLGGILGTVLGAGGYGNQGYDDQNFQRAAVDACGAQASRYGRVSITNVERRSGSTIRVFGTIDLSDGYQRRAFGCTFRNDGRIIDFDLN